jgi:hypothetical protein
MHTLKWTFVKKLPCFVVAASFFFAPTTTWTKFFVSAHVCAYLSQGWFAGRRLPQNSLKGDAVMVK